MREMKLLRNAMWIITAIGVFVFCAYRIAMCIMANEWDIATVLAAAIFAAVVFLASAFMTGDPVIGFHGFMSVLLLCVLVYMGSNIVQNGTLFAPISLEF